MVNIVNDFPAKKKNNKVLYITHHSKGNILFAKMAVEKDLKQILEEPIKFVIYSNEDEQWNKKDDDQIRKRVTAIITKEQSPIEPLYLIYLEANLGKDNYETAFSAKYLGEIKAAVVLFNGSGIEKSQAGNWKEIRECKNVITICDHKDLWGNLWEKNYDSCKSRYKSWKK